MASSGNAAANKNLTKASGFSPEVCIGYKDVAKEALAIDTQGNDWALAMSMVQCHFHKNFSCFYVPWRARLTSMYSSVGCENLTPRRISR